ncbi:MAG: type II 3-dehydroquinate dehydratase [Tetrasphaera sp.]|nr:type II 3-dehydroquinate dehydratase [Tetrasphaera sp.]
MSAVTARSAVIAVLNGPNLNLLGEREPHIYGAETLADVEERCRRAAEALGYAVDCRQSNHEGALVDAVHELRQCAGFVVNLGAYTHTSIALRDALATVSGPVVEVHISNVYSRETFRHLSYVAPLALAVISGCGTRGYEFAVAAIADRLAYSQG